MRSLRTINHCTKHMTLKQLRAIQENQYRSECCNYDYDPKAIDKAISDLVSNKIDGNELIYQSLKYTVRDRTGLDLRSTLAKLWLEDLTDDAIKHGIL